MGISSQIFIRTTCREPMVITWVQFLDGLPPKILEGRKPSKIWRDFWQLLTFIANMSETNRQIEKRKTSPTLDEKKTVNFGPQTKKLLTCILTHPSGHFSGDYFGPYGVLRPQFCSRAIASSMLYLAQTPTGMGVSKKIFNRENLKFGLKCIVCASISSELMGVPWQMFILTTCREPEVVTGTIVGWPAPWNFGGRNKRPKSGAISDNFRLWSRISPERIHKSKIEKVADQLQSLLRWRKKVGELWYTNKKVIDVHIDTPKWTLFGRLYFSL